MGWYFVSGTTIDGASNVVRVEAETGTLALHKAREMGLADAVLETDEVSALTTLPDEDGLTSDRELLRMRRQSKWQYKLSVLFKSFGPVLTLAGIALGLLVVRRWMNAPWGIWDWSAIGFLVIAFRIWVEAERTPESMTLSQYDAMLHAFVQADWQTVLRRCDQLQENTSVPASETAFRRATAMAALGDLEAGLALVQPWIDGTIQDPQCPEWVALSRVSEVYDAADQHEQGSNKMEQALELAPDVPAVWLDVALRRIQSGEIAAARQAMQHLEGLDISREQQPVHQLAIGCLANEANHPTQALEVLQPARAELEQLSHACELWKLFLIQFDLEIAISHAQQGNVPQARRHHALAKPLLEAHHSRPLLQRWDRLVVKAGLPV